MPSIAAGRSYSTVPKMRGYLARPAKATGKLPAILVIHENRGLNPHIEDITRRLALENFMAFAPDALFPLGGYPGTEDEARALFPKLDQALATRVPKLAASVPFYGTSPAPEEAAKIKAPLLIHLAENDQRVNSSFPPYEEALKANKVKYQAYTYPGTQHGFHNDTTPRYNPEAAKLAWTRTLEFFNKHLR